MPSLRIREQTHGSFLVRSTTDTGRSPSRPSLRGTCCCFGLICACSKPTISAPLAQWRFHVLYDLPTGRVLATCSTMNNLPFCFESRAYMGMFKRLMLDFVRSVVPLIGPALVDFFGTFCPGWWTHVLRGPFFGFPGRYVSSDRFCVRKMKVYNNCSAARRTSAMKGFATIADRMRRCCY